LLHVIARTAVLGRVFKIIRVLREWAGVQLFEMLMIFEALNGNHVVLACFRYSKSVPLRLALAWIAVLALVTGAHAAPGPNTYWSNPLYDTWKSPKGEYSIIISKASDDSDHSARLTLSKRGIELGHYGFDGQLISIYWSPGENYVAINNHYGHREWYVWILSLKNGNLIRVDGYPKSTISLDPGDPASKVVPYDRYLDYTYLPDVLAFAKAEIISVYPGFMGDEDKRGGGHVRVAYGWKNSNTLLMFDSVQLDNLNDQGKRLSILTLLHVDSNGLQLSNASVQETPLDSTERRPPEVVNILGSE